VTSEGESQTEPWVESKGARYPYAYDPGGKLSRELGVSGIPAAFLVDPTGKIVWQGHPGNLDNATVEKHLEGALTRPIYEWSGSAKKVKQAFLKGDFAKALDEAAKLAEDDPFGEEVAGIVRGILEGRMASYEAALERGDILKAYEGFKGISKGLKGLPEEERVKEALKAISKDKEMKATMKAQEKLAELSAVELRRQKDCDEVIADLEKLLKGKEGFVATAIEAKLKEVRTTRSKLAR
jgi:uncharacterized protein YktA (UPF0223 family)